MTFQRLPSMSLPSTNEVAILFMCPLFNLFWSPWPWTFNGTRLQSFGLAKRLQQPCRLQWQWRLLWWILGNTDFSAARKFKFFIPPCYRTNGCEIKENVEFAGTLMEFSPQIMRPLAAATPTVLLSKNTGRVKWSMWKLMFLQITRDLLFSNCVETTILQKIQAKDVLIGKNTPNLTHLAQIIIIDF